MFYENRNTHEVWKVHHIEFLYSYPQALKIYVFENLQRWCEEDFVRNWKPVEISNEVLTAQPEDK